MNADPEVRTPGPLLHGRDRLPRIVVVLSILVVLSTLSSVAAQDVVRLSSDGLVTSLSADESTRAEPDYLRARPMPLPRPPREEVELYLRQLSETPADEGRPGSTPGFRGTGETWPGLARRLYTRDEWRSFFAEGGDDDAAVPQPPHLDVENQAFGGRGRRPYTTSLVDLFDNNVSATYPYRAVGKLFFDVPGGSMVCSGAMVAKGLLLTAAHCVADNTTGGFFRNFSFVPAFLDGNAPYGAWEFRHVKVFTSYLNGSTCTPSGIVCTNDIAIVVLERKNGKFLGQNVGFLARGWNGFGYTPENRILITQLGYPASHNRGRRMVRTDAEGYRDVSSMDNTVWGSSQTGGSSGGPGVANFGRRTSGRNGRERGMNRVVQATSWGFTDPAFKIQGASRFTSSTLVPLVRDACAESPRPC